MSDANARAVFRASDRWTTRGARSRSLYSRLLVVVFALLAHIASVRRGIRWI